MKEKRITSHIYHAAIHGAPRVLLIGAGGTGSHLLHKLGMIDQQLHLMVGKHLLVTVCDDDIVEPHNCGRQLFSKDYDVGLNKAKCLTENVNSIYGTQFVGVPKRFNIDIYHNIGPTLVILAVDSVSSRKEIIKDLYDYKYNLMDIGNGDSYGQVLLSGKGKGNNPRFDYVNGEDIGKFFKGVKDKSKADGCSALDSLMVQNVLINSMMANVAANLITNLLYHPEVNVSRIYVNNETMEVTPVELL